MNLDMNKRPEGLASVSELCELQSHVSEFQMSIRTEVKDRSGANIELTVGGDVGSFVGLSSQPLDVLASFIHHPISSKKVSIEHHCSH